MNIENLIKTGYNIVLSSHHIAELKSVAIFAVTFILLTKTKIHPIFLIISSGIAGILLFGF